MERRGRIIRRLFVKPATGFAGRASAKPETCHRHSFSPGEKARMRAVVKSLFLRRGATFYRQSPSQVTGRASQAAQTPVAGRKSPSQTGGRFCFGGETKSCGVRRQSGSGDGAFSGCLFSPALHAIPKRRRAALAAAVQGILISPAASAARPSSTTTRRSAAPRRRP